MESSKNKIFLVIIALLLIVNIALIWFFVLSSPGKPPVKGLGIMEALKNEVGFDEAQMRQVEEMKKQHHEKLKPYFEAVKKSKEDFYVLLQNPQLSDSVKNKAAVLVGEKQQALELAVFANFNELRQLCKPGQLIKFDSSMQQVVKRMISFPRRSKTNDEKK